MSDPDTKWKQHDIEAKIEAILETVLPAEERPHLGSPFVSAYQLALAFRDTYRQTFDELGMPVGGEGIGQHTSLAQYLARQLSQGIKYGTITRVEGAPLTHLYLRTLEFNDAGQPLRSSLHAAGWDLTMFRLRD